MPHSALYIFGAAKKKKVNLKDVCIVSKPKQSLFNTKSSKTTAFELCFFTLTSASFSSPSVRATCLAGCAQIARRQQVQDTSESETKRFCLVASGAGAYGRCHGVIAVLHSRQVACCFIDGPQTEERLEGLYTYTCTFMDNLDFPILGQSDRQIINSVQSWEFEIFQTSGIINK